MFFELLQATPQVVSSTESEKSIWIIIVTTVLGSTVVSTLLSVFLTKYFDFRLKEKDLKVLVAKELFKEKIDSLKRTMKVFNELRVVGNVGSEYEPAYSLAIFNSYERLVEVYTIIKTEIDDHFNKPLSVELPLFELVHIFAWISEELERNEKLRSKPHILGLIATPALVELNNELHDSCVNEMDRIMKSPSESLNLTMSIGKHSNVIKEREDKALMLIENLKTKIKLVL